jgi:hypothetical protein
MYVPRMSWGQWFIEYPCLHVLGNEVWERSQHKAHYVEAKELVPLLSRSLIDKVLLALLLRMCTMHGTFGLTVRIFD